MGIKQAIKDKEIKRVVHFTRLENLESILEYGLLPKDILETRRLDYTHNDEHRLDHHEDAISCSICYPNYKMFYKLRMENKGVEWVVLGIKKKILWEKDVAFCVTNAADNDVSLKPIIDLKGLSAFDRLYDDYKDKKRNDLNIPDNYPTNPQAEVLVFDIIEPEYIFGIIFESEARASEYREKYKDLLILGNKALFSGRSDYEHWRQ